VRTGRLTRLKNEREREIGMGLFKGVKRAIKVLKKFSEQMKDTPGGTKGSDSRKSIIKNSRGPDTVMHQAETNDVGKAIPKTLGKLEILDMNKDQYKAAQVFKKELAKAKVTRNKKSRDLMRKNVIKDFKPEFDLKKFSDTTETQRKQVRKQQKYFNRAATGATAN